MTKTLNAWVHVFRHVTQVQVFRDKLHNVLLLNYAEMGLKLPLSVFSKY